MDNQEYDDHDGGNPLATALIIALIVAIILAAMFAYSKL